MKTKQTNDYNKFNLLNTNRKIDNAHVKKLVRSITQNDLTSVNPIIIDDKFNILDGQHRFMACELLDIPIHYVMLKTNAFEAMTTLNSTQRNWGMLDYAHSHLNSGKDSYKYVLALNKDFGVTVTAILSVLFPTKDAVDRTASATEDTYNVASLYKLGKLNVTQKDYAYAEKIFNQMLMIADYIPSTKDKWLAKVLSKLNSNDKFNFDELLSQLTKHDLFIKKASNERDYILQIEDAVNYYKPPKNKVQLYQVVN